MGNLVDLKQKKESALKGVVNSINSSGGGPLVKEEDIIGCSKCNGVIFVPTVMLGRVKTQDNRPGVAQIKAPFVCVQCGKVIDEELEKGNGLMV